jgi:predicted O-linked N-acetylglucosamine transferase (SPINDLY family)
MLASYDCVGDPLRRFPRIRHCSPKMHNLVDDPFEAHFQRGLTLAQNGQFEEAVASFQEALRLRPESAAAHNNLGNVFVEQGRVDDAVRSFRQALRYKPDFVSAHSNLGEALRRQGHLEEAVASFRDALRLDPRHAHAHNNLAMTLQTQGKLDLAIESYRQALRCMPGYTQAYCNLGTALMEQGTLEEAAANLSKAIELKPDYVEAICNLGIVLSKQDRTDLALVQYQQALRIKADQARIHLNRGMLLAEKGALGEAEASFRRALHIEPDSVEARDNLAAVLSKQGRRDDAQALFHEALASSADYALIRLNLGALLAKKGELVEAEAALRRALRARPDSVDGYYNLGIVLYRQERLDEAVMQYRQALRLNPDHADSHMNLGVALKDQGRLDDALHAFRSALRIRPDAATIHSTVVYFLNYHPDYDARAILEECARFNQQHAEPLQKLIRPHDNSRDPERRLRIGYVSPDFREHVDAFFTVPLLSNHDHEQCEVFCYADVSRPDYLTERLRGHADIWRSIVGLSDQEVADLVESDRIDILIDLKVHTANNRLLVFALKPAPVQVTWLGYPGTTGLTTIDYRLTDPHLDPPGLFDAFYSEESIRLPDTFWCYDPLTDGPAVNGLPALEKGVFTFGCLNNFCKVNDGCLALWADVLRTVPQSRLLLRAPLGQTRADALARFERKGIAEARIEFVDKVPRPEYLGLYHRIDLCLDPMPCNGHTTSLDAFWMGVPTLTLVGKTAMGRAGWSQLCNLGLEELAAETPEQYVALAAQWASDVPRLGEMRQTLRPRMQQSALMDGKRFARNMEQAYRQMWRRWCFSASR